MSGQQRRVNEPGAADVVALPNITAFLELAMTVKQREDGSDGFGAFYGPAGYGKSTAGKQTAIKLGCHLVECGSTWSARTLADAILNELNVHRMTGSIPARVNEIIRLLADEEQALLIIDESDHIMKPVIIDMVREISDKSGAAVIFIGEENLSMKMSRFARVHSRVMQWNPAQPCGIAEARALAKHYSGGLDIGDDLLKRIVEETFGVARLIRHNIGQVKRFAALHNHDRVGLKDYGGDIYRGHPTPRNHGMKIARPK